MSTTSSGTAMAGHASADDNHQRRVNSEASPNVRETSQLDVDGNETTPIVAVASTSTVNIDNSATGDESTAKVEPPLLYKYVLSKHWNDVLTRLEEAPKEAQFLDDFGLSPLHRACYRDAPVNVMKALIQASPQKMLSIQDKCDFSRLTPLHAACHYCSPEVVKLLLETSTEALERRNTKHQTPLECICQVYSNRIRHTLDRVAKDISEYDDAERKRSSRNGNEDDYHVSIPSRRRPQYADLLMEDGALCRFFKVACLLLQAQLNLPLSCCVVQEENIEGNLVHQGANCEASKNMVLACATTAVTIPNIFLEMCLKIFPEDVKSPASKEKMNRARAGNLALHEAIECGGRVLSIKQCRSQKNGKGGKASFSKDEIHYLSNLQMIVDAYPHAVFSRNSLNEVPFMTARRCGLTWSLGIQQLLQRNPEAFFHIPNLYESTVCHILSMVGRASGAAPVSALGDDNSKNENIESDKEAMTTSLVLGLLKCHPGIMEHACASSTPKADDISATVSTGIRLSPSASEILACAAITEENWSARRSTLSGDGSLSTDESSYASRKSNCRNGGTRSSTSRFSFTLWKSGGKDGTDVAKKALRRCQSAAAMANNTEPSQTFVPLASAKKTSKHDITPMTLPWLVQKLMGNSASGRGPSNQYKRSNEQQCSHPTSPCACATEPASTI